MESENFLKEEMIRLYNQTMDFHFHKRTYDTDIKNLLNEHDSLLRRIAECCNGSEEDLERTVAYIPDYAAGQLAVISSKRKRELAALDHKMNMVSYFVPLMGKIPDGSSEKITQRMVDVWNSTMPEYKIGHSTVDGIEQGFKHGMCYITTAVCRSLDKPDDCYELNLLRDYRDHYLLATEDGYKLVEEYYNIAPTIVKKINRCGNADEIYHHIWEAYLNPCVRLIEAERPEECQKLYSNMVRGMAKEYLYHQNLSGSNG